MSRDAANPLDCRLAAPLCRRSSILTAGSRLGPYEILAPLGAGGMGEVFRARDTKLGREVALKVLPQSFVADGERLARFEREAHLLATLNHPRIAAIYGIEDSTETRALVLELVEGPTLQDRIAQGALTVDEALTIGRQIAEALEAAHEKGVIHRDLKPANIKLTANGDVKVLDFGLAKAFDPATPASSSANSPTLMNSPTLTAAGTAMGVILGTAAYMAPEQARGQVVDKRADIWAFGVLVHEMLTGERLFGGDSVVDTLSAVMRQEIDFGRLPRTTPRRVVDLLRRALVRDPRLRLRDIGEARIALSEAERAGPDAPATASEARRPAWRSPMLALGALAVGVVAAVLWLRGSAPPTPEPVRVRPLTHSGRDADVAASPDGRLIAFTSWRDGVARIWLKQIQGGGEAPLTSGPDRLPRFSPDGSSLLFLRNDGTTQAVYRIALVGGEPRRVVDDAREADWSPDGKSILFVRSGREEGRQGALGMHHVESGKETILVALNSTEIYSARWSPDGKTILFVTGDQNRNAHTWELSRLDVASRKVAPAPPGRRSSAIGALAWSGSGAKYFLAEAASLMGDVSGAGSRMLLADLESGERQTILWSDGLAPLNASLGELARSDVLAPGKLVFGERLRRQNLREIDLSGAPPRMLTEGSASDRQPTYSPDGRLILFSSNRGGNLDLWTLDRERGALRQITDDPANDWDPSFTPDGAKILWSSDRGGHLEIWMANADGSGARQVSQDGTDAENPTLTRDGRWVVYWSGHEDKHGIWKVHPDGTGEEKLLSTYGVNTDVSPDGRYVLFVEQNQDRLFSQVRFLEVESGKVVPFTIEVSFRVGSPAVIWGRSHWSADGRLIYTLAENEAGLSGVFVQEFAPGRDTSATRRPVAGFSAEFLTESFGISPDGKHLTLSTGQESAAIMLAEGVPGALPPVRSQQ